MATRKENAMATPNKTENKKTYEFTDEEAKMLKRALNKMDQSTSRFLTTAQKEENDKAILSAKEELGIIAALKLRL